MYSFTALAPAAMQAMRTMRISTAVSAMIVHGRRSLHSSRAPPMNFGSHMNDNDPNLMENEKRRNLEEPETIPETIPDTAGWNQSLASVSEAVVKAEQCEVESVEVMQEHTVHVIKTTYGVPGQEGGGGPADTSARGTANTEGCTGQSG